MTPDTHVQRGLYVLGVIGIALVAYSAGFTRATILHTTSIIEEGTATTGVMFSVGRLPTIIGIMGFLGISLSLLSFIGWIASKTSQS